MKRLYKFLAILVAAIALAGCKGGKNEVVLPNLENMAEDQIQLRFHNLSKDLNLTFEYEYSNDVQANVFIKYKAPLKAGDKVKKDDKVTVIISSEKYELPNFRGQNETEVINALEGVLEDLPTLDFTYEIEYVHSDLAEGRFVGYKEPFNVGDELKAGDTLTVLISAEKFRLPNLNNKSKQQIIDIFDNALEGYPIDVTLQFQYVYNEFSTIDYFAGYALHEVGDRITRDTLVIVNLSTYYLVPDLTGLNKTEIQDVFSDLLVAAGHGITVNYGYFYPTDNNKDMFVDYDDDLRSGTKIKQGQTITVGLMGDFINYPNIEGRTKQQIETLLNNQFRNYLDLDFEIVYEYTYNSSIVDDIIVGFKNGSTGDPILSKEVVIEVLSKDIILPDLRGLNKEEIEDVFIDLEINLNRILLMGSYSANVSPGEFIRYDGGYKVGDKFDIKNNILTILYDERPTLPDLTGLNKKQIEDELANSQVIIDFRYIVNNNKEYDLFASYEGKVAGDELVTNVPLIINLYSNDDVNIGEDIANEFELFISKYIDGSGGNQGIELYNATDSEINLEDYYLAILNSGSLTPTTTILLTGSIGSNETYVIVSDNASIELTNKSDMQTSLMSFGANAAIQLRKVSNDTYIDSIYDVGNRSILMDREIYVRREGITHGRRDYVYSEWMGYVIDFYDLVGIHPYAGYSDPVFELIEDLTFQEYGMTLVKYLSSADGDTVYLQSLDPRDTTNYGGDGRIRFLLINAPETQKPGQDGEPYALVAKDFTHNMLSSASQIYLQASKEAGLTETFGRHLGLIWANTGTIQNPNWKLLNYELLKAGLGEMMIQKSGRFYDHPVFGDRYLFSWASDADNYARENKLGLYSGVHKP